MVTFRPEDDHSNHSLRTVDGVDIVPRSAIAREPNIVSPFEFNLQTSYQVVELLKKAHRSSFPPEDPFPIEALETETTSLTPNSAEGLAIIQRRAIDSREYRQIFLADFVNDFPSLELHHQSLEIMDLLADDLNEIFRAQMEHSENPVPRSWYDDAPQAVEHLSQVVTQVHQQYQKFLEQCPENETTLGIITNELAYAKDPDELSAIAARLEKLLFTASVKGNPVIYIMASDTYTFSQDGTPKLKMVEAELRLMFPYFGSDLSDFRQLIDDQSIQIEAIFKQLSSENIVIKEGLTSFAYGLVIPGFSLGSQNWSTTTGEAAVHEKAFLLSPSLAKSLHLVDYSFQLADLQGDLHQHILALIPNYSAHEMSHPYNNLGEDSGKLPEEFGADGPMIISNLTTYLRPQSERPKLVQQIPWEHFIAAMVGECATMSTLNFSDNDYLDGYIVSSRILINLLIKHRIIEVSLDKIGYTIASLDSPNTHLNISHLINDVYQDLGFIFEGGTEISGYLRSIDSFYTDQQLEYQRLTKFFADYTS